MEYVFLALGVLCATLFCILRDKNGGIVPLLLKTFASAFIAGFAFCVIDPDFGAMSKTVPIAFIFFILGDILLDLKFTYPQDSTIYTIFGVLSFCLAQILLIVGFCLEYNAHWGVFIGAIALSAIVLVGSKLTLRTKFGTLAGLITVYTYILCLSFLQTLFMLITFPSTDTAIMFSGLTMFLLSDGILCATYFAGKDSKIFIFANHVCYYSAIILIALSFLF